MLYHDGTLDPFAHLDEQHRKVRFGVFYATNRRPDKSPKVKHAPYSNLMGRNL